MTESIKSTKTNPKIIYIIVAAVLVMAALVAVAVYTQQTNPKLAQVSQSQAEVKTPIKADSQAKSEEPKPIDNGVSQQPRPMSPEPKDENDMFINDLINSGPKPYNYDQLLQ